MGQNRSAEIHSFSEAVSHVTDAPSALGATAGELLIYITNGDPHQLEDAARRLWSLYPERIDEGEAMFLASRIEARRGQPRPALRSVGAISDRVNALPARRYQASPDRAASRQRRRVLGGSSALPDSMRHYYTEGERSVLCVVAGETKRQGVCELAIDAISALAGVCRTTVQNTLRLARRLGHLRVTGRPRKGRKSLTNRIAISSAKWLAWIRRAPSAAARIGFNLSKISYPTKNPDKKKSGIQAVWSTRRGHGLPGNAAFQSIPGQLLR